MAKYDALGDWLAAQRQPVITLSFGFIADLVGGLPDSARNHRAWWGNEVQSRSHVQARAWLESGWVVDAVDTAAGQVSFRRRRPEEL